MRKTKIIENQKTQLGEMAQTIDILQKRIFELRADKNKLENEIKIKDGTIQKLIDSLNKE